MPDDVRKVGCEFAFLSGGEIGAAGVGVAEGPAVGGHGDRRAVDEGDEARDSPGRGRLEKPPLAGLTIPVKTTELLIQKRIGPPPLWNREPGFPTLIHIILEQQVSLASARAAFDKLSDAIAPLDPESFLTLDDADLKAIGFSGQKGRYCRILARAVLDGSLDLGAMTQLDNDKVRGELTAITGIGPWTADIYLLMVLLRPDVWPPGDLALAVAVQDVKGLDHRPMPEELQEIAEDWSPWRSVAARILWH
ncbi:MAG: DNA-3-methyladenine glycosylase 2 family protein, partial [Acidobacteria bacterium]|nr:DNA-3-methyladenine glycosylase 2 family protein [Candidatus Sulfomarinibacter sp. MAG AM2]